MVIILLRERHAHRPRRDPISSIDARVRIGSDSSDAGAGTNANLYLGLAGRKFGLDLPEVYDLNTDDDTHYVFGAGRNVTYPDYKA